MKKRIWTMCLAALLCVGMLAGCGNQGNGSDVNGTSESDESVSADQNESTAENPRIVVLSAAECEMIYAVGAGGNVVGRGEYCDYPAEVLNIPAVSSGAETNIEEIIALEPDIIFQSYMSQPLEQVRKLEEAGIRVVEFNAVTIQDVYDEIQEIGEILGLQDNAAQVVDEMKTTLESVKKEVAAAEQRSVYFEVSPLVYGLWAAGNNTFMNEVANLLGLKNCFDDVDGWAEISEEQVLQRNPDYIVSVSMYYGEGPTPTEEILARPGWEQISAVKNKKILNLQDNELTRPTPRLAEGAKALYDFVYGE